MRALAAFITIFAFTVGISYAQSFKPKDGFVPDEKTAVAIAVAVWSPIYGEEKIRGEQPYKASLKDGIWHVEGSLPGKTAPGGVAEMDISKEDGKIIKVTHGK